MDFDVLDASAFYAGIPFASSQKHRTTPTVFDEICHIKSNYGGVDALIQVGRLIIMEPADDAIRKVRQKAKDSGELAELSVADISVIALCVEHSGRLITDDYAVSNIAKLLGITVIPIMSEGTRRLKQWTLYCPACKRDVRTGTRCNVCGSQIKRRPKYVG